MNILSILVNALSVVKYCWGGCPQQRVVLPGYINSARVVPTIIRVVFGGHT